MLYQYRQGDVLLKQVESIPELDGSKICSLEGEEVEDTLILALGESTGHAHAIRNVNGNAFLGKARNENKFFLIVLSDVDLTHEEHAKITLPAGKYEFIRQREYSPVEIRQVAD